MTIKWSTWANFSHFVAHKADKCNGTDWTHEEYSRHAAPAISICSKSALWCCGRFCFVLLMLANGSTWSGSWPMWPTWDWCCSLCLSATSRLESSCESRPLGSSAWQMRRKPVRRNMILVAQSDVWKVAFQFIFIGEIWGKIQVSAKAY